MTAPGLGSCARLEFHDQRIPIESIDLFCTHKDEILELNSPHRSVSGGSDAGGTVR